MNIYNGGEHVEALEDVLHVSVDSDISSKSESKGFENSKAAPTIIQCSKLEFSSQSDELTYEGNVRLLSGEISLTSNRLDVFWEPDSRKVKRISAKENVFIRKKGIESRGDEAEWSQDEGKIVVIGNPVHIYDPVRGGWSFPHRLTWFTADDRILLEK